MSRLSKKQREEWQVFIGSDGRRSYNRLCKQCANDCKQSFRVVVMYCGTYKAK
jgi:hypothetical protein